MINFNDIWELHNIRPSLMDLRARQVNLDVYRGMQQEYVLLDPLIQGRLPVRLKCFSVVSSQGESKYYILDDCADTLVHDILRDPTADTYHLRGTEEDISAPASLCSALLRPYNSHTDNHINTHTSTFSHTPSRTGSEQDEVKDERLEQRGTNRGGDQYTRGEGDGFEIFKQARQQQLRETPYDSIIRDLEKKVQFSEKQAEHEFREKESAIAYTRFLEDDLKFYKSKIHKLEQEIDIMSKNLTLRNSELEKANKVYWTQHSTLARSGLAPNGTATLQQGPADFFTPSYAGFIGDEVDYHPSRHRERDQRPQHNNTDYITPNTHHISEPPTHYQDGQGYHIGDTEAMSDRISTFSTIIKGLKQIPQSRYMHNTRDNTHYTTRPNIYLGQPVTTSHHSPYAYPMTGQTTQFPPHLPLLPYPERSTMPYNCQMPEPPIALPAAGTYTVGQGQNSSEILTQAMQAKQEDRQRDSEVTMKNVMKLKNGIKTSLTIDGLRQEGNKGLQLLNRYFREVEQNSHSDPMRVKMILYTAEMGLLERLELHDEKILNQLTWTDVKRKLMSYLPSVEPLEAVNQLLSNTMTAEDDVEAFAAKMMISYKDMCHLLNVEELEMSLKEVLAVTMTCNMKKEVQRSQVISIEKDYNGAIKTLEKSFKDKNLKANMFEATKSKPSEGMKLGVDQTHQLAYVVAPNYNHQAHKVPFQKPTIVAGSATGRIRSPPTQTIQETSDQTRNISAASIKRRETFRSWRDWECVECKGNNRATWFTCNQEGCNGRATKRQAPNDSWDCVRECGQTNWKFDHYCHCCHRPNEHINPDLLRELPSNIAKQPRDQPTWFSQLPAIRP